MFNKLTSWAKQSMIKGEIDTIKMKILVPGSLARDPNWKIKLEEHLADKELELARIQFE